MTENGGKNAMKTGIESGAYIARYGWEAGLERMKRHGYDTIDFDMADTEHNPVYTLSSSELSRYIGEKSKLVRDSGLEIFQTHGPWRWPPRDGTEEERAERFEKMALSIKATAAFGCRNFVIHPVMPFGDNRNPHPDEFHKINFEFMNRLTDVAEKEGVVICFENMPMPALTLATPAQILGFVKEIGRANFKVCLDTGHCAVCGVKPGDAVRLTGKDYLAVLHVHDNNGHGDFHWLPYTGVIDWKDFSAALKEIGYDGCLSLETKVPSGVPEAAREPMEQSLAIMASVLAGNIPGERK